MKRITNYVLAGTAFALLSASSAQAGGFQRGTADTDILFEKGTFSSRFGYTYVNPNRGFSSINGVEGDYGNYTGIYNIPSAAVAFGNEDFGCAGTYTIPFAAEADYDGSPGGSLPRQVSSTTSTSNADRLNFGTAASTSRTLGTEFSTDEFGATCRISYSTENSRFSLLGGVFVEDFRFDGQSIGARNLNPAFQASGPLGQALVAGLGGAQLTLPTTIDVDSGSDYSAGYRIGLAYEMPEIALRAQIMYRSEVKHEGIEGTGTVTVSDSAYVTLPNGATTSVPTAFAPTVAAALRGLGLGVGTVIPVTSYLSDSISPASLTISAQTGIAAGTLLLGSFRWTDWSTNNSVVSTIELPDGSISSSYAPYNWKDGYTASIGIGRAFNEQISGVVSLGYDSGVSTGSETTYTDLYTLSGGVSIKPENWAEIRFGALIGYWTSGDQTISDGAYFNATVDDTFVYAGSASLKLSF
ncbi:long-chain fatty acid transporter [Aureimonas sp. SA4125]|uniref:outer membrane protein transport protein n=1 Tax=Aureimonas sp. SA4125 TaxID=2826993 RepID=UPI001CC48CE2|nr:outer membrane protein transport protein [Aureimonas sp. SA4125]BDA84338.1 long-chain fatty acid transporter [Aureimonas sp. SA4125]